MKMKAPSLCEGDRDLNPAPSSHGHFEQAASSRGMSGTGSRGVASLLVRRDTAPLPATLPPLASAAGDKHYLGGKHECGILGPGGCAFRQPIFVNRSL